MLPAEPAPARRALDARRGHEHGLPGDLQERGHDDHLLHALRHGRRAPRGGGVRVPARRDRVRVPLAVERGAGERRAHDPRHRRHRDGGRDVGDVQPPVRRAPGERRRLLLGRHRHADHALRLRRDLDHAGGVLLPWRVRHERHLRRVPRPLSRRDQDGRVPGWAGERRPRLHQQRRRHRRSADANRELVEQHPVRPSFFDPFGLQFVAVDGDGQQSNGGDTTNNLWFHDGNTGLIVPGETKELSVPSPITWRGRPTERRSP